MAKKKVVETPFDKPFDKAQDALRTQPRTFKPMPKPESEKESPALEGTIQDKQPLIDELLKVEGVNQELAEEMAQFGVPDDSYTVQAAYRVSAVTADAVIKIFTKLK